MSTYAEMRTARPIRHAIAVTIYRLLWWPLCVVLIPFVVFGAFVDWLSWTAFPAIARTFQPLGAGAHQGALRVANLVLGHQPEPDQ